MSVDETLAKEVLRVVQPAAVEAARLAREEEAHKQDEVLEVWKRDLVPRSVRRNSTMRRIRKTD
jgi:hypothetical protein